MGFKRIFSDEHKQKISQAMTGKRHSVETCNKISQGLKKAWSKVPREENNMISNNFNNAKKNESKI